MFRKGFLYFVLSCCVCIGVANAAERSASSPTRTSTNTKTQSVSRSTVSVRNRDTSHQQTGEQRSAISISRPQTTNARSTKNIATRTPQRTVISSRSGLLYSPIKNKSIVGRAASILPTNSATNNDSAFGADYTTCRDAYFTCMDQFCASMDDTYRRCICSSRLNEIKQKQSALSQSTDSLTAFHDLNMDIIKKSAGEVAAITSATVGEQMAAASHDNSQSAQTLSTISDVLNQAKNKSLSTAGTLDAGGDIKSIWTTTDLASGANIANLTGETLYNAVNAQCSNMVAEKCPESSLNMIISAYGMYIENDCSNLATNLAKQKNTANSAIRETGREMGVARLENYDAHNSLSINECIASVRQDLTANTACGPDFVHCLDITGLYLNIDSGEPIYSPNFYNLANQISLSGNILNNQTNHMIVNTLNTKKIFAEKSLDKCRDLSGDIWDEFMRQAIIEIHQKQQEKIRTVRTECLGVVNDCYDTQTNQLKDFSNIGDKTLLGLNMETVEDLCREKLDTCSNLYGGGPNGLTALVNAMHDIVSQRIVAECQNLLQDFGNNLCAVQSTDTLHTYPYTCRVYSPGDQRYATIAKCNDTSSIDTQTCGVDYANSLYQRFVNYAMQVCIRPSEYETLANNVPTAVLQDINIVMDKMRIAMGTELSRECERLGGIWVSNAYNSTSDTSIELLEQFYTETGANKSWGYCKSPIITPATYTITFDLQNSSNNNYTAEIKQGTKITITPPTDTSCSFKGYYTEPNGGGTQYFDAYGNATRAWDIASNTTLYAFCTYTVTLNLNGGQNGPTSVIASYGMDMPTLSTLPTQTGYTFEGFYDAASDGKKYYNADGTSATKWDKQTTNTTLYAHWEANSSGS